MNFKLQSISKLPFHRKLLASSSINDNLSSINRNFSSTEGTEKPKKSFNPIRSIRNGLILSSLIAGGSLYFLEDARNFISSQYPPSKDVLDIFEKNVGFYKPSSVEDIPKPKAKDDSFLNTSSSTMFDAPKKQEKSTKESMIAKEQPVSKPKEKAFVRKDFNDEMNEIITRTELAVNCTINDLGVYSKKIKAYTVAITDLKKTREKKLSEAVDRVEKLGDEVYMEEMKIEKSINAANEELDSLNMTIQSLDKDKELSTSDISMKLVEAYNKFRFSFDSKLLELQKSKNDLSAALRTSDIMKNIYTVMKKDLDEVVTNTQKKKPENRSLSEANALLMMAEDRLKAMQQKLQHAEVTEFERINDLIDYHKNLDSKLAEANLKKEIDRLKNEISIERQKWKRETNEKIEEEMKSALARHGEHLSQVLKLKEAEMEKQFDLRKREIITKEQESFDNAIRIWTKRMEAIEKVVDGRADSDRVSRETQVIWLAVKGLAGAINFPVHGDGSHSGPLKGHITKILASTQKDSEQYRFAQSLVSNIKKKNLDQGVYTALGLRTRFEKVYEQCKILASVKETDMSLWSYVRGYLKSFLLFDPASLGLKQDDYLLTEASEIDPREKLQVMRILTSCHQAVSTGNFQLAIKLLGLLDGQAKIVASDWVKDAINYLEVDFISKTLLAYSSAQGFDSLSYKV